MAQQAFDRLFAAYADPDAAASAARAAGRRPIRFIGCDAPLELLRASGFQPVRLRPRKGPTPHADAAMGQKGLGPRARGLLEALLAPGDSEVPVLITSADTEQVQLFATLREMARLGDAAPPPAHLLDLRHQPRASSADYSDVRLAQFAAWLGQGGAPDPVTEAHRALLDRAEALRRAESPWLSGTDMLRIRGAMAILPASEHRALLEEALADIGTRPAPAPGPRILLTGSAHDDAEIYAAVEALGATIVGEDHERSVPLGACDPRAVAKETAQLAETCGATHVVHLTIGNDEAAPWTASAIGQALGSLPYLAAKADDLPGIARFLAGEAPPEAAPKATAQPRPAPARRADDGARSRKALASVADFGAYQRDWFQGIRRRAAAGEPIAVVNANAPQEILRALDIPFVVNQWWASIVAAKQQSRRYLGLLRARGYPTDVEPYSAQGIAAALDTDAEQAPWGGLPRPDFLHAVLSSDATAGIFGNWSAETDAAPYLYERSVDPAWTIATDWWDDLPDRWDETLEPARLDLTTAEIRDVIGRLESATGRRFDPDRFEAVMHLVNEQEDYYRKTRDLIARTVPAPIGIADSMPATMVPQWHRGTEWARDAAKAFYEEVAARVQQGAAAVPDERVRLMWIGRGMWSEMGFYQRWEESHGAVFVWSMYLALAADGYIRRFDRGRDPLRALAARFITMGDELRMPSWAAPWHVHEARTHAVDGAVAVADADPFVLRALAAAGIPVLDLGVDNFNREGADADAIDARIAAFIEGPASAMADARRGASA